MGHADYSTFLGSVSEDRFAPRMFIVSYAEDISTERNIYVSSKYSGENYYDLNDSEKENQHTKIKKNKKSKSKLTTG